MNKENKYNNISPEKFKLVRQDAKISDVKFDTKPIGYFKDAFIRFKKNKSSVVAAIIIVCLLLFAVFAPIISKYETTTIDGYYNKALPKAAINPTPAPAVKAETNAPATINPVPTTTSFQCSENQFPTLFQNVSQSCPFGSTYIMGLLLQYA